MVLIIVKIWSPVYHYSTLVASHTERYNVGVIWFLLLLRGESLKNIDMDFLADLASLGPKLVRKKKNDCVPM